MDLFSLGGSVGLGVDLKGAVEGVLGTGHGHAQFELRVGPFLGRELDVISFEGREAMNAPYAYEVVFASSVPAPALQAGIFGSPACLTLKVQGHEPRLIQGIAVSIDAIGSADAERATRTRTYRTRIVPRLWLLNHRRRRRVFQDRTALEIALAVLDDAGVATDVRLEREAYGRIPFVYQRDETDLEFLNRVLASAGIFYFFEHASGLLDELLPGAGAVGALAGGLSGVVAGAAATLGVAVGAAGGVASSVGAVSGALKTSAVLILTDAARHTLALRDTSIGAEIGGAVAGAALQGVTAGLTSAAGSAFGSVGGSVLGSAAEAVGLGKLSGDVLPFDDGRGSAAARERVFAFRLHKEVRPRAVRAREWSVGSHAAHESKSTSAAAKASVGIQIEGILSLAGASLGAGAGADITLDALPIASADVTVDEYQKNSSLRSKLDGYADRALGQLRSDWMTGRGRSDCRRLAPGYRFKLARHPIDHVNGEYLVTEVRCEGYSADHLPKKQSFAYRNRFRCVPGVVDPRPKKPSPQPAYGLEPAQVIGPVRGDVHTDALGRILVRFRWARETGSSEQGEGTCWVYWLERWAGAGFGTMNLPRVGSEVLVEFIAGDANRPVAVGQIYTAENGHPFPLPGSASRVGIRSQTIPPGVGYSEFAIEDADGMESVNLRSQGRLDVFVETDHTRSVGGSSHDQVVGTLRTSVGGERVEFLASNRVTDVGKDSVTHVGGLARLDIDGALHATIGGDENRTVGGALDVRVGKDASHVYAAEKRTVVGHPDREGACTRYVYGPSTTTTSKTLTLESDTSIVLKCGETTVEITPDGVKIGGKEIAIDGSKKIALGASKSSLSLGDDAELVGKNALVASSGASLALKSDVKLTGSKVNLGSGGGKGASPADRAKKERDKDKPKYIRTKLLRGGKPAAGVAYSLKLDGGMELSGSTTGDGLVEQKVPDTTASAVLTFLDTNETRTFVISGLEAHDTVIGAQYRLRQLGYYAGAVDGVEGPLTHHGVSVFQEDAGIAVTGSLDSATINALKAKYGS